MEKRKPTHLSKERTLVMIKPDGVQRSLIGEIVKRFERAGLKMVGLKMIIPNKTDARKHYLLDSNWLTSVGEKSISAYREKGIKPVSENPIVVGNKVLDVLVNYMTSGPVVAIVLEGAHAVSVVRKLVGGTEPLTSDVGTIRGDFVLDSYQMADTDSRAVRNLIHASGSVSEAKNEIKHWFSANEILKYRLISDQILYDVNLDGILE